MKAKVCLLDSHQSMIDSLDGDTNQKWESCVEGEGEGGEAEGVEEEDIELFYDDLEEDFEEGLVRNFLEEEEEEI